MTEEKELVLKDLCARLPYGVKCCDFCYDNEGDVVNMVETLECIYPSTMEYKYKDGDAIHDIERIKPYLRPMSSMTEEEFEKLKEYSGLVYDQLDLASFQNGTYKCLDFYLSEVPSYVVILVFNWLNAHHFDYRGLIELGLGIDCTGLNIYENEKPI